MAAKNFTISLRLDEAANLALLIEDKLDRLEARLSGLTDEQRGEPGHVAEAEEAERLRTVLYRDFKDYPATAAGRRQTARPNPDSKDPELRLAWHEQQREKIRRALQQDPRTAAHREGMPPPAVDKIGHGSL